MTSVLLVGPTAEPISLADAKTYLRVSGTEDDSLIETLIAAARVHVETLTRRALITQDWRKVLDCWPEKRQVELPLGPIQSLVAVRSFDERRHGNRTTAYAVCARNKFGSSQSTIAQTSAKHTIACNRFD